MNRNAEGLLRGIVVPLLLALGACATTPAPRSLDLSLALATEQPMVAKDARSPADGLTMRFDPVTLECQGAGEYRQLGPTSEVVIRDERGERIGGIPLGVGRVEKQTQDARGVATYQGCAYTLRIPLNRPARIYTVDLGDGKFLSRYHVSEIHRNGGRVMLSME